MLIDMLKDVLKVKKIHPDALLPIKKGDGVAYDLYACIKTFIAPRSRVVVHLGIACEFPDNYVARICDRSGMAVKEGLHVMAGVLDPSYRGEWKVILYNTTEEWKTIDAQTRIAQVLFYEVADFSVIEVDELGETKRGTDGFGSTGVE